MFESAPSAICTVAVANVQNHNNHDSSLFHYLCKTEPPKGSRVLVPFGPKVTVGIVTNIVSEDHQPKYKLKHIIETIDEKPLFNAKMMELAEFLSSYYLYPLGKVLKAMLPPTQLRECYSLTADGKNELNLNGSLWGEVLRELFQGRENLTKETLRRKILRGQKDNELGDSVSIKTLKQKKFIRVSWTTKLTTQEDQTNNPTDRPAKPKTLTENQKSVLERICEESEACLSERKPILLHGITGSGKTEIYLQTIQSLLDKDPDSQTLVLVPEIALTPQMTNLFTLRFPGRVAVVHSALTTEQRWKELTRIHANQASVLIGARSAVFAPFANLKCVIVDEEHESTYKQTNTFTYNARDVAVMRAKIETALLILGSATPSLESYWNSRIGKYRYLEIKSRPSNLPLPIVNVEADKIPEKSTKKQTKARSKPLPVSDKVIAALRDNFQAKQQSIVIVNRRGFANFMLSEESKEPVLCPSCSISLTLHKRAEWLLCHYCDYRIKTKDYLAKSPDESYTVHGYGSQRVEEIIQLAIPKARVQRVDSDSARNREAMMETFLKFRNQEIDILVGTQILAKGHDFPGVSLTVLLELDQALNLPDFRAGERAFQLMVQAAGRSGRAMIRGEVLIRSNKAESRVIRAGLDQNYQEFAEGELSFRKAHAYPPFSRLVSVELNSQDEPFLDKQCAAISNWLDSWVRARPERINAVRILGPSVSPIEKIRGRYRRSILFSSDNLKILRESVLAFRAKFCSRPIKDLRAIINVDPQSIM